jgi:hypothetical protein
MRSPHAASAALLLLVTLASGDATADTARSPPPSAPPPATLPENDAAARHAKRTACLKEAKTRKLLGAQKSAFLKGCVSAP